MKNKLSIIILLMVFICGSFLNASEIKGAGSASCGSWLEERRNGTYYSELNWIFGFISSYNHYHSVSIYGKNGVFKNTDYQAIAAWMDNYCKQNPLLSPYQGTVQLIEELKQQS